MLLSSPETAYKLIFSISSTRSKNHIKSFKHAVSRTMKIVGDGNWSTPIGFSKYSTVGKKIFLRNRDTQANHSYSKASEIKKAKEIFQDINDRAGQGGKVAQAQKLREKLAKDYDQLTDDQRRSISNLIERLRAGS